MDPSQIEGYLPVGKILNRTQFVEQIDERVAVSKHMKRIQACRRFSQRIKVCSVGKFCGSINLSLLVSSTHDAFLPRYSLVKSAFRV